MGCDIHGYIEIKKYDWDTEWYTGLNIKTIVGRNYDMFGLLFGVRNYDSFLPLAAHRGIPTNASELVRKEHADWAEDAHSATWVTWDEIAAIKWTERGTSLSGRISTYRQGEDKPFSKFSMGGNLSWEDYELLNRGESLVKDDIIYKRDIAIKEDAISGDWQCLFDIMRRIDEFHKAATRNANTIESVNVPVVYQSNPRIRLVVWFDN